MLDTPGHQAFTAMRLRGANITDIAILVIAADDGIREQTIESINHARVANTPLIIAITKCDKENVDIRKIYSDLFTHEIVTEAMGGEILNIEISAETGKNLDKLTEAILLQAELLELKARPQNKAAGVVVESKLDKGRGNLATALVLDGTLRKGDILVAGAEWGRVKALFDEHGKNLETAPPSTPVEILGLQGLPMAGDSFDVMVSEAKAREIADYRKRQFQEKQRPLVARGVENMFSQIQAGNVQEIAVILKADMQGSLGSVKNNHRKAQP